MLLVPWLCQKSPLFSRPPSIFCPKLSPSMSQGCPALPLPISSPRPHTPACLPYVLTTLTYIDHSKYLLEKGEKWFAHGCPRPSSCHLSSEPFSARALFPAYMHSDVHPQLGLKDKPRIPAQGCTSHSGSTAHHRGPWSVHSSDQNCRCHTCNWPPEMGC